MFKTGKVNSIEFVEVLINIFFSEKFSTSNTK